VSDLSELFEQLADGPVLLATAFASVDADRDNGGCDLHVTPRLRGRDERATHRVGRRRRPRLGFTVAARGYNC
jgi:hypothetical protein